MIMKLSLRSLGLPFFNIFSSLKLTVICLLLLLVLTFWGTIAQVENGLYLAQERYFHSFYFLIGGWIPFPGAQLILGIFFFNLVCLSYRHLFPKPSTLGIPLLHFGLQIYFLAAFTNFYLAQESNITLQEGEGSNVSSGYHDWELSVWKQDHFKKKVLAYDIQGLKPGKKITFPDFGLQATVINYFPHAEAIGQGMSGAADRMTKKSSLIALKMLKPLKEPEKNMPGLIFQLHEEKLQNPTFLLSGGRGIPTEVIIDDQKYLFQLRRRRFPLPFLIKLKEFKREYHPNTDIPRSYESLVEIQKDDLIREVLISMNNPLRYKNFTLYQASFALDTIGREYSTLAVVRNSGRYLPYLACLITFSGLVTHFMTMAFRSKLSKDQK